MGKSPTLRLQSNRRHFPTAAAVWGALGLVSLISALTADRLVQRQHRLERTELKIGLIGAVAFAALSVGFALASNPNRYFLELTRDGFTERLIYLRWTRCWRDIERFEVGDGDGRHVAFQYNDHYRARISRWWARSSLAVWGRLIDDYGEKPDDLCDQLNEWRVRYAAIPGVKTDTVNDWP